MTRLDVLAAARGRALADYRKALVAWQRNHWRAGLHDLADAAFRTYTEACHAVAVAEGPTDPDPDHDLEARP